MGNLVGVKRVQLLCQAQGHSESMLQSWQWDIVGHVLRLAGFLDQLEKTDWSKSIGPTLGLHFVLQSVRQIVHQTNARLRRVLEIAKQA
jgi:hypothetical protein